MLPTLLAIIPNIYSLDLEQTFRRRGWLAMEPLYLACFAWVDGIMVGPADRAASLDVQAYDCQERRWLHSLL